MLGQGSFGMVYSAQTPDGEVVAIKKVVQDPKYKNRELDVMKMLNHRNCVRLMGSFKTSGQQPGEVCLNLVMEYLPLTLQSYFDSSRKPHQCPSLLYVKLFSFQLFAGLAYLHELGVTHRDLKPENVLVNAETGDLKICDFGSAKLLQPHEESIAYIASRYYRAPELLLGHTYYTNAIDIWAAGCVIAEMLSGDPLFGGRTSSDQLAAIVRIIGQPTKDDIAAFPLNASVKPSASDPRTLTRVLPEETPAELLEMLASIFVYDPARRPTARDLLQHKYFDALFGGKQRLPNGNRMPDLDRGMRPVTGSLNTET
jgi:glycogen synthase kinase 3 beta